jgi:hypothetical protein
MIFDSNFKMGLIKEKLLPIDHKVIIFSVYILTFAVTGIYLATVTYGDTKQIGADKSKRLYYYLLALSVHIALSFALVVTVFQMFLLDHYSNAIFYLSSYVSLLSSLTFLLILSFTFLRWFKLRANYLTLSYGILFSFLCCGIIIAMVYLVNGLDTHPLIIKPVPPRVLIANTYTTNVSFQNYLGIAYDLIFLFSFILAWILSIMILRQYSRRMGKFLFWVLVALPLIFYITRYDNTLNYLGFFIISQSSSNIIPSSLMQGIFLAFESANIQLGAVFFAIPFMMIALKLKKYQLNKAIMVTVIGITLVFSSRDLHSLFVSSFPPGGVVTVSFMSVGSYMLLVGLTSLVKQGLKDKQFYNDLQSRIENDDVLFKHLISSERKMLTLEMTKPLIEFSMKWQRENLKDEMNLQDIREIVNDVISEIRKKKSQQPNI